MPQLRRALSGLVIRVKVLGNQWRCLSRLPDSTRRKAFLSAGSSPRSVAFRNRSTLAAYCHKRCRSRDGIEDSLGQILHDRASPAREGRQGAGHITATHRCHSTRRRPHPLALSHLFWRGPKRMPRRGTPDRARRPKSDVVSFSS